MGYLVWSVSSFIHCTATDDFKANVRNYVIYYVSLFSLFLMLLKYSCLHFPPSTASAPPIPTSHPRTHTLWLCPRVRYTCSLMILPLLSPVIRLPLSLWLLSICSLFQCLWLYILLACLFHWLGSTYRWDHMVFAFTAWLISLSIMLSRSIHAVAKSRSSFLSAA